jgi:alkylation response protein AidB-like acyl-CoA dehydrogenase
MDFRDTPEEAAFRTQVRDWLADHLTGEFAALGGVGGEADETGWDVRIEWEKLLGADRWVGLSWPVEYGGRGAGIAEQVIFQEEYARAKAPARVSFFGEGLFAPTLIQFGTEAQKRRYLPRIQAVDELWCQGFSEPNAGSDLANVQTRAVLDGDEWVINGQKVWTTLAHRADWCFVVTRTDPRSHGHKGLSFLLVDMHQPGVEIRPLRQMTGSAEFNEVFFNDARTPADHVLGPVGEGWTVAMATLGFERGTAFLSRQLVFQREMQELIELAQKNGATSNPLIRDRLAHDYAGVRIMQFNGQRMLTQMTKTGAVGPEASIGKLYWSTWHRAFGETAMQVLGADGLTLARAAPGGASRRAGDEEGHGGYEVDGVELAFLASRAETIYAGASEIQRNIIGERVLGLPREPTISRETKGAST